MVRNHVIASVAQQSRRMLSGYALATRLPRRFTPRNDIFILHSQPTIPVFNFVLIAQHPIHINTVYYLPFF
jgi:hypothetical protein